MLNDHVFKGLYSNWLIGKLSDLFGIVVFVQFFRVFVNEKFESKLFLFTAIAFTLWKSELSSEFIELWNSILFFQIQRVVDYTDLICLFILIPLYKYKPSQVQVNWIKTIATYPLILITFVAILATSRAQYFNENNVYINDFVKLKMDRNEFLNQLTNDQITYTKDSIYVLKKDTFDRYTLNNIVISSDTIYSVTIGIKDQKNKLNIYVENAILSNNWSSNKLLDYEEYKKWSKRYRAEIIELLNN